MTRTRTELLLKFITPDMDHSGTVLLVATSSSARTR
jgi:hypothetical protein